MIFRFLLYMVDKKDLLTEMQMKQHSVIDKKYRLENSDIERLCKYINKSIFTSDGCVLWSGYLTKSNGGKSHYVNFFIKGKKLAVHRILYINFIGELKTSQYLKYTCENPGCCCNLSHFYRIDRSVDETENVEESIVPTVVEKSLLTDSQQIKGQLKLLFSD